MNIRKKGVLFILISTCLFLLILGLNLTNAEEGLENDPLINDIQEGADYVQGISEKNDSATFLSQEWEKFLRENKATSWIYKLNPLFKFFLAQEFSISLNFFVAVMFWIIIFGSYYPPIKTAFKETITSLGISIALSVLTAQVAIPKILEGLTNVARTLWNNLTIIILLFEAAIILNRISIQLSRKWQRSKEKSKIKELEEEAEKNKALRKGLEGVTEGAKAIGKGYKEKR